MILDENLDHRLRLHLAGHEVFTAEYMGWSGLKNGKLLQAAEDHGFEVLITGDKTLFHEQNLSQRKLAIVALSSIEWRIIQPHLSAIVAGIDRAKPGSFESVDCGSFTRR